jgi:hypothetical protein
MTFVLCADIFVFTPNAYCSPAELAEALREYFKPLKLLPAIVPSGYVVGDVYEFPSLQLIYRADTCFDRLQTRETEVVLASGTEQEGWFAELQAKLRSVIGLGGGASGARRMAIRFHTAAVTEAARGDMLSSLKPECSQLRDLLRNSIRIRPPLQAPIAKVLSAKFEVYLTGASEAEAKAKVDDIGSLFGTKASTQSLDAAAAAKAGWNAESGWVVVAEQPTTVAYMPAVVLQEALGDTRGEVVAADPTNPVFAAALGDLSDMISPVIRELDDNKSR